MRIETSKIKRSNNTYLQGIAAYVIGTPASELKAGDHVVWNGGTLNEVTAVHDVSKCYVVIDEIENGKQYYGRKIKKTRIIARPIEKIRK